MNLFIACSTSRLGPAMARKHASAAPRLSLPHWGHASPPTASCSRGLSVSNAGRGSRPNWRPGGKRASLGKKVPPGKGGKGGSSGQWMKRHLKDPYVNAAVESGMPSRAAYKLVEMNAKHGILFPGDRVVDLGAAPGGWSAVAARIVHGRRSRRRGGKGAGAPPALPPPLPPTQEFVDDDDDGGDDSGWDQGRRRAKDSPAVVVAVDLLDMEPLPGVEVIRGDFREASVEARILAALERKAGPEHSEGSPSASAEDSSAEDSRAGNESQPSKDENGNTELYRDWSSSDQLFPPLATPSFDFLEVAAAATGRKVLHQAKAPSTANVHLSEAVPKPPRSSKAHVRATVVLSDMAPSFTGDRDTDQARVAGLVLDAFDACLGHRSRLPHSARASRKRNTGRRDNDGDDADELDKLIDAKEEAVEGDHEDGGVSGGVGLLAHGGTFLGKLLAGRDEREVKEEAERLFEKVKVVKPPASRSSSSEMYLLATGFLKK